MTNLALTQLTLSHFRSHRTARLSLDGRPVALFGANGAGKTNILEAVSLFSPGRGLRRAPADEFSRQPEALGWKLTAELANGGRLHELETWAEPSMSRQVRIDGKISTQTALSNVARMVWLVPSMDRLWIEGADGRRRFLDRIALSFEPKHAEASLTYEKAMRERNKLLKDQVRDPHWYVVLERQMAEAGVTIQENRLNAIERLSASQQQSDTVFPISDLSLTSAEGSETPSNVEDFHTVLGESRQRDLYAGRTLIGPHRADLAAIYRAKGVPAKQCSTGEQKALLISVILANARSISQDIGAPPIILLDEVAAHLDGDRRAALYHEICALKSQAWMTGTGAELFSELKSRAQLFEIQEMDQSSTVMERG